MNKIATVLASIALYVAGQSVPSALADASPTADFSCEFRSSGHLLTDVYLNDEGPFKFIVDTAATVTAVSHSVAARLNLSPLSPEEQDARGEKERITYTLLGRDSYEPYQVSSFALGGIRYTDFIFIVLPQQSGQANLPDGVLGLDVLDDFFLLFDLGSPCRMALYTPGATPQFVEKWRRTQLRPRSVREVKTRLWFITPRYGYRSRIKQARSLFDLGSNITIVNSATMRSIGLGPAMKREKRRIGDATGRTAIIFLVSELPIHFARNTWRQDVLGGDLPIFGLLGFEDRPAGIIGIDLFRDRQFAVDFEGERLLLAPKPR